jgi:hypothetical protein
MPRKGPLTDEQKARKKETTYAWRAAHPERIREYNAKAHAKLTESQRTYQREWARKERAERRRICIEHYGGKCECCGETNFEFLCLDHINGGGKKQKESIGGGPLGFFGWVIKNNFPDTLRCLCYNCNFSYGVYNYCPHHPELKPVGQTGPWGKPMPEVGEDLETETQIIHNCGRIGESEGCSYTFTPKPRGD